MRAATGAYGGDSADMNTRAVVQPLLPPPPPTTTTTATTNNNQHDQDDCNPLAEEPSKQHQHHCRPHDHIRGG
jgi:hypothetical protein